MLFSQPETAESQIKALLSNLKQLDQEFDHVLAKQGISLEELNALLEAHQDPTHPLGQKLSQDRQKLDEKLTFHLQNVKDPLKLKQSFEALRGIQAHWIAIR